MTIVVGVATPEGLVLASDSRMTSVGDDGRHRIVSDSAQKVFRVGDMGVASFGAAMISGETIGGLMDQFAAQVEGEQLRTLDFATRLRDFYTEEFQATDEGRAWDAAKEGYPIGFLVGGYDEDGIGHIRSVLVPGLDIDPDLSAKTTTGGMYWQGQRDVVNRLLFGYDNERVQQSGVEVPDDLQEVLNDLGYVRNPCGHNPGRAELRRILGPYDRRHAPLQRRHVRVPEGGAGLWRAAQLLAIERRGATWIAELKPSTPTRPGRGEEES